MTQDTKAKRKKSELPLPIAKPHDSLWKLGMGEVKIADEIIQTMVSSKILEAFDLTTLENINPNFIDGEGNQSFADIVYRAKTKSGDGYLVILAEHQSTPDEDMTLRMINYTCRIIEYHLKQGYKHYPIVVPILYYNGKISPYPYSTDFFDYFENPELAKSLMFKPFNVVDVSDMSDEELLKHPLSCYMTGMLKYVRNQKDFTSYIEKMYVKGNLSLIDAHVGRQYLESMVNFTLRGPILVNSKKHFIRILQEQSQSLGEKAMSIIDREILSATQKLNHEHNQHVDQMVKNMLHDNKLSIQEIHNYSGLAKEKIRRLKQQLKETVH